MLVRAPRPRSGAAAPEALAPLLDDAHARAVEGRRVPRRITARCCARSRARYRLAVVSNFDYTPTALGVLEREGIADLFETIVVSDEVGWRKPKPIIFELALEPTGARRRRDALFVGDRADIDVAGAQGVGMRSAWINRERRAAARRTSPPPDYEIRDLARARRPILGIS